MRNARNGPWMAVRRIPWPCHYSSAPQSFHPRARAVRHLFGFQILDHNCELRLPLGTGTSFAAFCVWASRSADKASHAQRSGSSTPPLVSWKVADQDIVRLLVPEYMARRAWNGREYVRVTCDLRAVKGGGAYWPGGLRNRRMLCGFAVVV
ncbi:hypothetical protein EJ06DRAFT_361002 [Trichodelitschia bisporula]|uniref:Uncharacterized protein n=1 Tax=Trichodelitschia bisporula TaxID=703511 RepID=A0A6G1I0U2_9PEZI|nr:hypothetical protein EJ06DRAFT_361002 [Trichodelitschia bisporula]